MSIRLEISGTQIGDLVIPTRTFVEGKDMELRSQVISSEVFYSSSVQVVIQADDDVFRDLAQRIGPAQATLSFVEEIRGVGGVDEVPVEPVEPPPPPAAEDPPTITVGARTATSVALSWTSGSVATGTYQIQYKLLSARTWTTDEAAFTGTSKTLTGLQSATSYDVRIRRGSGPYGTAQVTTTHVPPTATVGTRQATSVALSWTGGSVSSGTYQIDYKLSTATGWTTATATHPASPYTVTGLTPGASYDFRVRRGDGPFSAVVTTTTGAGVAPTLTVGTRTASTVALSWTGGDIPSGNYQVDYRAGTTGAWTTATSSQAASPYTVTGLTASSTYQFRIRRGATGPWSAPVSATTTGYTAPTLTAGTATQTTMPLTWTGGDYPSGNYQVDYRAGTTGAWTTATSSQAASPYTVTGLDANTSYQFRVRRTSSGPWSATVTKSTLAQTAPTLTETSKTAGSVSLSWTRGTFPGTRYQLEVQGLSGFLPTQWSRLSLPDGATTRDVTGLSASTTYRFRIRANDGLDNGPWSSTLSVTTEAGLPFSVSVTRTSATFTWSPRQEFELHVGISAGSEGDQHGFYEDTTYTLTQVDGQALQPGTTYYYVMILSSTRYPSTGSYSFTTLP